ncbi:hypothetical protein KFK09_019255 [Dendrobium nobile]|uniref:Uncharacterized protein n=1 Tax=Dendrobium nobile TaxID=94219 RepID=A0A8T3AY23_DENNO|nr:hypothetical protein KFK09_019255 [Dendrobium nobile]
MPPSALLGFRFRACSLAGSIFGKPLKSDLATAYGSRPSVARILVEMDVNVNTLTRFGLVRWSRGHSKGSCTILHPNLVTSKPAIDLGGKLVSNPIGVDDGLPGDSAVLGNEEVSESRKVNLQWGTKCSYLGQRAWGNCGSEVVEEDNLFNFCLLLVSSSVGFSFGGLITGL